jgi:nitrous oxide reductase accessory protein NosL
MRIVLAILTILILLSCENHHEEKKPMQPIKISSEAGTPENFNVIDIKGRKQGIWIDEQAHDTVVYLNDTAYLIKGTTAHELWHFLQRKGKRRDTVNIILKPDTFKILDTDSAR